MALAPLKDVLGKTVYPGDEIVLLVKEHGYRGLVKADLVKVVYLNPGPWGYEFLEPQFVDLHGQVSDKSITPYRFKQPQCVKIEKQQ